MRRSRLSDLLRWVAALAALSASLTAAAQPRLVLWKALDCGPCTLWERGERRAEFEAEAPALGLKAPAALMVRVVKPSLKDPPTAFAWPAEARELRDGLAFVPRPRLLPSFDFVCGDKLLHRAEGLAEWDSFWREHARELARDCPAAGR